MLENTIEKYVSIFGDTKETRIMSCKIFLKDTDYAIIKLYETVCQGGSIITMLKDYAEILKERKEARNLINELEGGE